MTRTKHDYFQRLLADCWGYQNPFKLVVTMYRIRSVNAYANKWGTE